ncbi:MAG TPA: hypothetical protein DDX71_08120 [Ruminococcus sp.]|nr:hypothetical protein [Ruminococcus sp.]
MHKPEAAGICSAASFRSGDFPDCTAKIKILFGTGSFLAKKEDLQTAEMLLLTFAPDCDKLKPKRFHVI